MANTEVFLIRHGLPEYEYDDQGRKLTYGPDAPLSEEGQLQAQRIAEKIPTPEVLISSPFKRALQTAEIIASHHGIDKITEMEIFKDQQPINFEGRLLEDAVAGRIELHPDDETDKMVFERINKGFDEIVKDHKGKKIGIVFHGHPIRYIVWKRVEKNEPIEKIPENFLTTNYPLQGEAWQLVLNEEFDLIESRHIVRDDNENPGAGKW